MLKLNRLTLSGFKSFVDSTELDFAGGITAIVGPNGCGKSNVADAVVWALGERSAKSLRGATMEDVIFAGSEKRKPVGTAEVTLELLTDPAFDLADDAGRIRIGRRVHRSGESQYSLNGRTVRLKDIRDFLMDTGLGIRAYSMIEQGKIGMILSGKPQERRRLLEEAAGITRYKERRRVAEVKLEEARDNLSRLDDIVGEIERSLRSLKRQSNAARRYKERQDRVKDLYRRLLGGRWARVQSSLAELGARIADAEANDAKLSAEIHQNDAELAERRETEEALTRELASRHQRDAELAATIEGRQEFIQGGRDRLSEIGERVTAGASVVEARTERRSVLEKELAEIASRIEALSSERDAAASEVTEDDARISQVAKLVQEAEDRVETLRSRLLTSLHDVSGIRNRLHAEQVEREKAEFRRRHLGDEIAARRAELEEARKALETARSRNEEAAKASSDSETRLAQGRSELDELVARIRSEEEAVRERETRRGALDERRTFLQELAAAQDERRQTLRERLADAGIDTAEFLGDQLNVSDDWAEALDLYLGDLEDAVLTPPGTELADLAGALGGGRGTTLLLGRGTGISPSPRPDDDAVLSSLADSSGLPEDVAASLPPAWLVRTGADAERLAARYPGVAFVSRDRSWARSGLFCIRGTKAAPGQMQRRRELESLASELEALSSDLTTRIENLEKQRRRETERRSQLIDIETALTSQREEAAIARTKFEELEGRCRRLEIEHETMVAEGVELDREIALAIERETALGVELKRNETLHIDLEATFDRSQNEVEAARVERESTRTSGASRRGRLELLDERLQAQNSEAARIRAEISEIDRQAEAWKTESARLEERRREIQAGIEKAEAELQDALEARARAQEAVLGEQSRLDELRAGIHQLAKGLQTKRDERDEARAALGELKVESATLRQEANHIASDHREAFRESPPETPEGEDGWTVPGDLVEVEADHDRLRERLERMGPVNLLAAEEFDEQTERHGFLVEQRDDVRRSVESLRKTIREINETSAKLFQQTFEEVNEQFGRTFVDLFRGGEAEMRLMDPDDPLESGIEIVARPPGKRLQNILLMSGGEKALTALALVFSLFRTKPSPFCILDEVDAPLDDINTLRFVELLKKMSAETQFIVITHNKLTMEAVSRLYGVTMQERGVSKLVSVELDEVTPEQIAKSA